MTAAAATPDVEWQRLDPRMLLIHPIKEIGRYIIPLVVVVVAGSQSGGGAPWELLGVIIPVAIGVLRYLTTRFRVTGGRVELKRGLISRHVLSVHTDRVRTVDLTSDLIHRALGLTVVKIGTGTASKDNDEAIDLDSLPVEQARALRLELLRRAEAPVVDGETGEPTHEPAPAAVDIVTFSPSWSRFAPFTSTGFAITAAGVGLAAQLFGSSGSINISSETLEAAIWVTLLVVGLGLLISVTVTAVIGYLMAYWEFRLTRTPHDWHISRGLLTTRETSLDQARVAGVSLCEPLGLRIANGARLSAIVTGLGKDEKSSSMLVPPAPEDVVRQTAVAVLGDAEPVQVPLLAHGLAATRRRYVRALAAPGVALVVIGTLVLTTATPGWLLIPALLFAAVMTGIAADRARGLGHAWVGRWLIARSGSLTRKRQMLDTSHIIGWNFRSTWFQRRVGLTSIAATTAGGPQSVHIPDAPDAAALATAYGTLPQVVGQFLA